MMFKLAASGNVASNCPKRDGIPNDCARVKTATFNWRRSVALFIAPPSPVVEVAGLVKEVRRF